jgi:Mrp family chromosome partitioning ATPase
MMDVTQRAALAPRRPVITFYSYKGGTGRTMALANCACLFARDASIERVLAIDWDLEAPGLHYYLDAPLDGRSTPAGPGVLEYFTRLGGLAAERGANPDDPDAAAEGLLDQVALEDYCRPTRIAKVEMMPAGRLDETYQSRLAALDWVRIYERAPSLFRAFAERLTWTYDVVLVDARTGMTDMSGICTSLLPDTLIVVFTPNQQSLIGVERLVVSSVEYRQNSRDLRPLLVFPLPSRIDAERDSLRRRWRGGDSVVNLEGYQPQFERIFRTAYARESCDLSAYFNEVQVQHSPDYAFGEQVAALEATDTDRFSIVRSYEALLRWLKNSVAPWDNPDAAEARARLADLVAQEAKVLEQADLIEPRSLFDLQEEIVRLSAEQFGPYHVETVAAVERLVATQLRLGEDISQCVRMLDTLLDAIGQMRPAARVRAIAATLAAAGVLRAQGHVETADRLMTRAAEVLNADSLDFDSDALDMLEVTAQRLREGFLLGEARVLQEAIARDRLRLLGERDLLALQALQNLADTLRDEGDVNRARQLYEQVVEARQELLGADHPDVVTSLDSLAATLRDAGDVPAARAIQERVWDLRRVALGDDHPDTLRSATNLANTLRLLGELTRARQLQEHVLEGMRRLFGEDHPDTLATMSNLAETLRAQNQVASARTLQDRVLELRRQGTRANTSNEWWSCTCSRKQGRGKFTFTGVESTIWSWWPRFSPDGTH